MAPLPEAAKSPVKAAILELYERKDRSWRARWAERFFTILGRHYADEHNSERTYLGMSVLGDECEARLWLTFRWAHEGEPFDGRMLRLFETGHIEEARIIADLDAIGVVIEEIDPATGGQWAVSAVGGHVRGHMDGRVAKGLPGAPKTVHVFENKTHNAKYFKDLKALCVEKAKPQHYAQMQGYMHLQGISRAVYVAVEKDTDDFYIERINYDPVYAAKLLAKGERIVTAEAMPPRQHENPASKLAWKCGYCPAFGVCHDGKWARRNCRTCLHATAKLDGDGRWHCARHDRDLSKEDQRAGCGAHLYLPDLVPGKQVDADAHAETVTYVMRDGSTWVDGAERGDAK